MIRPGAVALAMILLPGVVLAQSGLESAARSTAGAWLRHDVGALFNGPDPILLVVPGADVDRAVVPSQASAMLRRYWEYHREREVRVTAVRDLGADAGWARLTRSYVIEGTLEPLQNQVLIGFQRVRGEWRLTEIRIRPRASRRD